MRLENLISEIDEEMFHKIVENRSVKDKDAQETAKIVGLSAIKYGDLSNQATKDYIFDIDRLLLLREIQAHIFCIRLYVSNPFSAVLKKTEEILRQVHCFRQWESVRRI